MASFPSPEQKEVIESDGSALIVAGPGTGKTRTAIEKARWSIKRLTNPTTQRVLFLSFSNAAIFRLAEAAKVNLTTQEKKITKFQTYHSFAADLVNAYGRFVGLPPKIQIADTLERTLLVLENDWDLYDDAIDNNLIVYAKSNGVITFEHLIPFAIKILTGIPSIRKVINRKYPVIIVDEFQDTSQQQWDLLRLIGDESSVTVFGDPNQIIYSGLHKATARRFEEFKVWKGVVETPFTPKNFRCGSVEILSFAESILQAKSFKANGDLNYFPLQYRTQLRVQLVLIWKAIRDQVGKNESVAFLTPSNKLAEEASLSLRVPPANSKLAFPVYASIVADETAFDSVRLAYTAFREYTLSIDDRTRHNVINSLLALRVAWKGRKIAKNDKVELITALEKQLEIKGTLFQILYSYLTQRPDEILMTDFILALSTLPKLDTVSRRIYENGLKELSSSPKDMQLNLFAEDRFNRLPKGLYGTNTGRGLTQVMTYYKSKGREFDFVVLISDPREESTRTPLDEKQRLYYVSATRAKKWLGVIYYSNDIGNVLKPVVL